MRLTRYKLQQKEIIMKDFIRFKINHTKLYLWGYFSVMYTFLDIVYTFVGIFTPVFESGSFFGISITVYLTLAVPAILTFFESCKIKKLAEQDDGDNEPNRQ